MFRTLLPPKTPKEAVESRRNPCYGFGIIADILEHKKLVTVLQEARDNILRIIDPDREIKKHPIRSPLYIKQKFFHAAVFGMPPLLEEDQFIEIFANEQGLLNGDVKSKMCDVLQVHLQENKPFLEPVKCEMMNDGTILARFAYQTKEPNYTPLLTLARQLDPEKKFSQWDASNPLRYTTVTVALCVIDKDQMKDKLPALQEEFTKATEALARLGNIDVHQFQFISHYNKRTLSEKHIISRFADITEQYIHRI